MMNDIQEESNFIANYKRFVRKLDNLYWKKHPYWYLEFKKFDNEKFKEIEEYFGLYFVSNYGQVVSFHHKLPIVRKFEFVHGYLGLGLCIMGQNTFHFIHNLVCRTFLAPLQPGNKVIHQNGITTDNYYKNLEIVSITPAVRLIKGKKYDFSLYYRVEFESKTVMHDTVTVLQFDMEGKFIREYKSLKSASVITHIDGHQISACMRGEQKSAGGYQWRYKKDLPFKKKSIDISPVQYLPSPRAHPILQFDLKGNFIKEYPTILEAEKHVNTSYSSISKSALGEYETAGGFQWRYKDDPIFKKGVVKIAPVRKHLRPSSKPILQFGLDGKFIKEYSSIKEAGRAMGKWDQLIGQCAKGRLRFAYGFQWKYKNDPRFAHGITGIEAVTPLQQFMPTAILQFDLEGNFIKEHDSIASAARCVGVSQGSIGLCVGGKLKMSANFQWRNKEKFESGGAVKKIEPLKKITKGKGPVLQFDIRGKFVKEYASIREAACKTGVLEGSIRNCLYRIYNKSAGNFQWRLKSELNSNQANKDIDPVPMRRKPSGKPVFQFDINGKFITRYPSVRKAARILNISRKTISACAERKYKTSGGFQWRYQDDPIFKSGIGSIEPLKTIHHSVPVIQFELSGKYIREYPSAADAAKTTGLSSFSIYKCLGGKTQTACGYQWRYKNDPAFKEGIKNMQSLESIRKVLRKPVLQFNLKGKFIRQFSTIVEAAHILNIPAKNIGRCVNGKSRLAYGYQWRSANDPIFENGIIDIGPVKSQVYPTSIPVLQYDFEGNLIREYKSINEAWEKTGITRSHIANCVRGRYKTNRASGYIWKFKKV
jgi:hypothetical protein